MRKEALVIALLLGCSPDAALLRTGGRCPCAASQVCCPTVDLCAASIDACPNESRITSVDPTRGAPTGGYRLRLTGRDLDEPGLVVTVDDRTCEDVTPTDGGLFCTAPAGPAWGGAASVVVKRAETVVAERDDAFRYEGPGFVERGIELGFDDYGYGPGTTMADLDRDGRTDVFFSMENYYDASPAVVPRAHFVQTQPGVFTNLQRPDFPPHHGLLVADVTNDAIPELIYSMYTLSRTAPLRIETRAGFGQPFTQLPVPNLPDTQQAAPIPYDLDADGDLDLLACARGEIRVLINDGDGGFTNAPERIDAPNFVPDQRCVTLQAGDLDADGVPELVLCGQQLAIVALRDGRLVDVTDDWGFPRSSPEDCTTAAVEDFDLDGDNDVMLTRYGLLDPRQTSGDDLSQSGMFVYENTGDRLVLTGQLDVPGPDEIECAVNDNRYDDASLRWGLRSTLVFDADLDGDGDVLVPTPSGVCAYGPLLYLNRIDEGAPGFTTITVPLDTVLVRVDGGAAGDLDGDGDIDALFNYRGATHRAAFLNTWRDRTAATSHYLVVEPWTDRDGDATDSDQNDDRRAWTVVVEVDLDGPDFDRATDRVRTRVTGDLRGESSHGLPVAHFGLGAHEGPVWVRVYFTDGSVAVQRVDELDRRVSVRDCGAERC